MNFAMFAHAHGLLIRNLYASGKIHRCGTEKHPHSSNGAYFFDGERGWVLDWSAGDKVHWWNDSNAKPWTDADKKAWADKRGRDERSRVDGYAKAAMDASRLLSECHIDTHPYLSSKFLSESTGLIYTNGSLFIPMRNCMNNELQGLQSIKWNEGTQKFHKKFMPGMKAKGAVFKIGSGQEIVLCEGYATGLSIYSASKRMSMNISVMCCFSASNIIEVAKTHGKYVFADNDHSKTGEKVAEATGLPWIMPDQVGMDWNDVHAKHGIMHVCKALIEIRRIKKLAATG